MPEIQPVDRKAVEELQSLYLYCLVKMRRLNTLENKTDAIIERLSRD
ncbi:hypothetical protein [Chamaesiphon sp. OTE_8_metabat_110]|nr:hypothetical protein [Chamaesiphon sp. OTE_8_metabat_110]